MALSRGLLRDGFLRFHPRGISRGHKFPVRARGRETHQFHKFVTSAVEVPKNQGVGRRHVLCVQAASSGIFFVYPAVSCSVMYRLRNTQSRYWNETTAYKTDVCILSKLLDEKVASLHLPVLGSTRFLWFQIEGGRIFGRFFALADSSSFVVHCKEDGSLSNLQVWHLSSVRLFRLPRSHGPIVLGSRFADKLDEKVAKLPIPAPGTQAQGDFQFAVEDLKVFAQDNFSRCSRHPFLGLNWSSPRSHFWVCLLSSAW